MELTHGSDYNYFIEELQAILVEGVYNSNLELIQTYHQFGQRIYEEMQRDNVYGQKLTERIAKDLGKSQRTIQKCVRFAKDCPNLDDFLSAVDEGKSISWRKIANHYLVEPSETKEVVPVEPVNNIAECIRLNLKFLIDTATIKPDGIHLFLPKDMCSELPVDK
jgi:hypothetical protein